MKVLKQIEVCQIRAYREQSDNGWSEFIAVYNDNGDLLSRSPDNHPEGNIFHNWNGYTFVSFGYSGNPRTECYVKVDDKVWLENNS